VPVFADCDDFGLLDLDACERALEAGPAIRFFVPVHLYGHALDAGRLRELRRRYGLSIVEDCAQSIRAAHGNQSTGTAGHVAATSFYPTKNLGALGDGGAILTGDEELAASARRLRDYGQSGKYRHDEIGYNSRLDELQAAILRRSHLPRLPAWTARRRAIAERYNAEIRHPRICLRGSPPGSASCWHLFPVFVQPERKRPFLEFLRARQIAPAEHYPAAVIEQAALRGAPHQLADPCVNALRLCASEVSLPIHPYMTDAEVRAVIDACNSWDL
jgi:dTDP-3-amino-3,4,6-trideoxy-alpha-D-glucose transaminase